MLRVVASSDLKPPFAAASSSLPSAALLPAPSSTNEPRQYGGREAQVFGGDQMHRMLSNCLFVSLLGFTLMRPVWQGPKWSRKAAHVSQKVTTSLAYAPLAPASTAESQPQRQHSALRVPAAPFWGLRIWNITSHPHWLRVAYRRVCAGWPILESEPTNLRHRSVASSHWCPPILPTCSGLPLPSALAKHQTT